MEGGLQGYGFYVRNVNITLVATVLNPEVPITLNNVQVQDGTIIKINPDNQTIVLSTVGVYSVEFIFSIGIAVSLASNVQLMISGSSLPIPGSVTASLATIGVGTTIAGQAIFKTTVPSQ